MSTDTYNSSTTWVCPAGVTSAAVECWGAGGGGGNASGLAGGAGGTGGAYAKKNTFTTTPGNSYTVHVGSGSAHTNGGDSWFDSGAAIYASGGPAGGLTTTDNSVGDVIHLGAAGGGPSGTNGGGGGSSGGTSAAGNAGSGVTAGAAVSGGGAGGNGGAANTIGSAGSTPGGAGGGGGKSTGTGAAGGNGQVSITYTPPAGTPRVNRSCVGMFCN